LFTASSRYLNLKTVEVEIANGRKINAVVLRRLPYVTGVQTVVKGNDRLDVMSQRLYKDPTEFWHIADANTELQANDLVRSKAQANPLVAEEARVILVPEK
jgi:hypothetical protein